MSLSRPMAVQNRIGKVQKRSRALVRFDPARICKALSRAAASIGGFRRDFLPGINDTLFAAHPTEESMASFLADAAIMCLNSDPRHHIVNFPPTIETVQDEVFHALRSYGFQHTADAYECYRWGRHWLREGRSRRSSSWATAFRVDRMPQTQETNRQLGCRDRGRPQRDACGAVVSRRSSPPRWRTTNPRWTRRPERFRNDVAVATRCA